MLKQYSKGFVPKNTDSNTQWAVRNFEAWRAWRTSTGTDGTFVPDTRELLTGNMPLFSITGSLYLSLKPREVMGSLFLQKLSICF